MLLNAPYPADIRVKKEAQALLKAGWLVHLICLRKKGQSYTEVLEGIEIKRIDAGKNNYQLAFWDVIMSMTFVHPLFKRSILALAKQQSFDLIHVHDLPLVGTALKIKRLLGIKVVADMHENYPEALRTWFNWKRNPIVRLKNRLFMNPQRWTSHEKYACQQADAIIAVVEEMKWRISRQHHIDKKKIHVITNTEGKDFVKQSIDTNVYDSMGGGFIITYSGGIGPHRGVDTTIEAFQFLKGNPKIKLAIVGCGSSSVMNNLKHLVARLQLSSVYFLGYQPFSKFYSFMHLADVNIIPHHSTGHTDNTVPHKLFQGMMAGKPLLVSSSAPLKRIVDACSSGLVFEAGNPTDLADKILVLYHEEGLRAALGANGRQSTLEGHLNWEITQKSLLNLYDHLTTHEPR